MRTLGKKLRTVFHDIYYARHPKKRIEFALRCRHVAEIIDLQETKTFNERFRYHLHLAVCQPCKNYLEMTQALKRALLDLRKKSERSLDIDELNRDLIKKYVQRS